MNNPLTTLKNLKNNLLIYKFVCGIIIATTILSPIIFLNASNFGLSTKVVKISLCIMMLLYSVTIIIFSLIEQASNNKFNKMCVGLDVDVSLNIMREYSDILKAYNRLPLTIGVCYILLFLLCSFVK